MGFSDVWNRTLVYFGIAEEEDWDEDGYALWYKRLEAGVFRFPAAEPEQRSVTISAGDLALLLDGVDLASVRRGRRYRRPA